MNLFFKRLLSFALGAALLSPNVSAAVATGILAPGESFKPTGSISESHLETLQIVRNPGGVGMDFVTPRTTKKVRVTVKADLTSIDTSQFNGNTQITLKVGYFDFSGILSSDPKYVSGKKSVRIALSEPDPINPPSIIKTGVISFAWTAKTLTASLTWSPYAEVGAIAPDLLGAAPTPNQAYTTTGKTTVTIGIAGVTGTRVFLYKARLLTTEKTFNLLQGPTLGQAFNVTLTGGFDVKAPALKSKFPTTATSSPFNLRLEFAEADLLRDARLGVDGVTGTYTSIPVENDAMTGAHFVQVNNLQLPTGTRKLALSVRDESGNIVIVKKTVKVSP